MTETRADARTSAPTPAPRKPSRAGHAPWLVRAPNGLVRRLMRLGVPMGPNVPMTVRGRTSGLPRTAPSHFPRSMVSAT
jgi:hypothetical protein